MSFLGADILTLPKVRSRHFDLSCGGVRRPFEFMEFGADEGKVRLFVSEVSDGFFGHPDTTLSGVEPALIVDEVIGIHYDYEYYRVLMGVPYKDTLR